MGNFTYRYYNNDEVYNIIRRALKNKPTNSISHQELLKTANEFGLNENEIGYLLYREILPCFNIVSAARGKPIVKADPSDDKFLWCAHSGKADYIISSDKHMLSLKSHEGIPILTPSAFLKSISV